MSNVPTAVAHADLTTRPSQFEAARKAARRGIVALLVAEGATPADIARIFGVSRQLASRLVLGLPATPAAHDEPLEAEHA